MLPPSSLKPIKKKSLVSYWLEVTVYDKVLIHLNTVRTGITVICSLLQDITKADRNEKREWNSDGFEVDNLSSHQLKGRNLDHVSGMTN